MGGAHNNSFFLDGELIVSRVTRQLAPRPGNGSCVVVIREVHTTTMQQMCMDCEHAHAKGHIWHSQIDGR